MSELSPTLARVEAGRLCAGCGACAAISQNIRMQRSVDGFLRPEAHGKPSALEEQQIAAVCPGLGVSASPDQHSESLWGRIIALRSGYAKSDHLRFRASSGGALSALLVHLIEAGCADYVLHTGADPEDAISNKTLSSRSREEIESAAGSRYAPSAPLDGIAAHLASGERFVFVGKPCDVAALRAMARIDPRVDRSVVCMISFFCAGIPSRHATTEILTEMGAHPAFVARFRYRGHGWPGKATACLSDGTQRRMSYHDSWGRILSRNVQFRCKICPDGTGNAADIVCADAWHGDADGYPTFEEADGQSLILSRTDLGEAIVQGAIGAGMLDARHQSCAELVRMQLGQVSRMRALLARLLALKALAQPAPVFSGFKLLEIARGATLGSLLRNFLGTGRRVLMGRR